MERLAFILNLIDAIKNASTVQEILLLDLKRIAQDSELDLTNHDTRKFFNRYDNMLIKFNPFGPTHSIYITTKDDLLAHIRHAANEYLINIGE